MIVTVLGCGGSGGVPLIGNDWGLCNPANPKNRRLRASVLVEEGDTTLLIDASPDLRQQLLTGNVQKLTAVLFTHGHADHTHGIDDLRSMNWRMKAPIDIYADPATLQELVTRFDYIFKTPPEAQRYYKPSLIPHEINGPLEFGSLKVTPFEQDHAYSKTLGFRINDFAYTTDAKTLPEDSFKALEGAKVWIVDCVGRDPHPTHSHLQQTLSWIERVNPKKAYLTHMGVKLDYDSLRLELPKNVAPAYDGLKIELV